MPAEAADISRRLGGFPDDHLARQLGPAEVRDADLVIALAREHRSEVVRSMPRASRYTFTLREFARLLESAVDDPQMQFAAFAPGSETSAWLRAAVPQIAARRGFAELPVEPEHDDVIDPYRQEQSVYDLSAAQIEDAMDRIQRAIRRLVPRLP
jgi:protein-tyrosine phosphatase